MVIPQPTAHQKQALLEDRDEHRTWLQAHNIKEPSWALKSEKQYTGLLLASLLDPDASVTVCRALTAGFDPTSAPSISHPTTVHCPDRGPDLVARLGCEDEEALLIVEHKRFGSPSHAPGYKKDTEAAWQTDQIYMAAAQNQPPPWFAAAGTICEKKYFVVLDAHGMTMEQLFPEGEFNRQWTVTSYPQFGAVIRKEYEHGARGLVPLLSALYAGH